MLVPIGAPALVMPCATDQYFLVHEAGAEAACMPQADFRVMQSEWGHCAGGPGRRDHARARRNPGPEALIAHHALDSDAGPKGPAFFVPGMVGRRGLSPGRRARPA